MGREDADKVNCVEALELGLYSEGSSLSQQIESLKRKEAVLARLDHLQLSLSYQKLYCTASGV